MTTLENDLHDLPAGIMGVWHWASQFQIFCGLDGSDSTDPDYAFPSLLAIGARRSFELDEKKSLNELDAFLTDSNYGYLVQVGYGLKDRLEEMHSRHDDPIGFPTLYVFEPEILIRFTENGKILIQGDDPLAVWQQLMEHDTTSSDVPMPSIDFQARCSKEVYLEQLNRVKAHLQRGDCYELNYCQEFFAENVRIDPFHVYVQMNPIVRAPFSCLYRNGSRWLIGGSPERFLKKDGDRLESQPMKGTAPREKDPVVDTSNAEALRQSEKDRSENIMVVDLVRNDLSRIAQRGSVSVDSLCELRSFPQVHQLVSTVRARIRSDISFREILSACFPMGSMTGAPKVKVMELTDRYELSARGLYSGSIGFIDSDGNFDLNVVIRGLQYHADSGYLSYHVGSGITIYSDPEKEWEECRWKSAGIRRVFGS